MNTTRLTVTLCGALTLACIGWSGAFHRAEAAAQDQPRVVALVGDRALGWGDLAQELAEAAGGQILEETALRIALEETCRARGLSVPADAVNAERRLLAELLASSADVSADDAERLVADVRARRGRGERRFEALLWRNAALRMLVRKDALVQVSDADIDTAYALKHGPRFRARLILVTTMEQAEQVKARLAGGESFADVAAQISVDPSSARGGMLDPFSPSDARYPVAVRRALADLPDGATSLPIAVTWGEATGAISGFAVLKREGTISPPGQAPQIDTVRATLEREIRTVRERAEMDKLARALLEQTRISAMDGSLNWSWSRRQDR